MRVLVDNTVHEQHQHLALNAMFSHTYVTLPLLARYSTEHFYVRIRKTPIENLRNMVARCPYYESACIMGHQD